MFAWYILSTTSVKQASLVSIMEEVDKERSSLNKNCRQRRWKSVVLKIAIEGVEIRLSCHFMIFAFFNGDLNSVMEKRTFFFL